MISGDSISGTPVRILEPVTVEGDPFSNDDVSYSGPGRVVGLALAEEGGSLRKASELVSVRWSFCGEPGCEPDPGEVTELTTSSDFRGKTWEIPAGDYRLYLTADGEPVDVALRLHGLAGTTRLRPSRPVAGAITAPTSLLPVPARHLFLGRAEPVAMPAPGLLIDGDTSGYSATYGGGSWAFWGLGHVPAGKWRSSYWSVDATALPQSSFLTLWVSYEGRG